MQGYANWGGMVKELGCQIVTRKMGSEAGKTAESDNANRSRMAHLSPPVGTLPEILNLVVPPLFRKLLHFA